MHQFCANLLITALCGLCVGCGQVGSTGYPISKNAFCVDGATLVDGSAVWLCGESSEKNVNDTIELLAGLENPSLVIDSVGGDTLAGIELARYIGTRRIPVFVNKVCLSSCSQFLLLAAPELHFRPYSVIGMHDTQTSTNIMVNDQNSPAQLIRQAQLERAFYNEFGIDERILTLPTIGLNPTCIVNRSEYRSTGALVVKAEFDFLVPDEQFFQRFFSGDIKTRYPAHSDVRRFVSGTKFDEMWDFNFSTVIETDLKPLADC